MIPELVFFFFFLSFALSRLNKERNPLYKRWKPKHRYFHIARFMSIKKKYGALTPVSQEALDFLIPVYVYTVRHQSIVQLKMAILILNKEPIKISWIG